MVNRCDALSDHIHLVATVCGVIQAEKVVGAIAKWTADFSNVSAKFTNIASLVLGVRSFQFSDNGSHLNRLIFTWEMLSR